MKPYDTKLIMVVAQTPFTTESGTFCKLVPLRYVDGGEAEEADFLNDGEIWWMLTPTSRQHAVPGKLIVGDLEDAIRFDRHDPNASEFQVKRESAHAPGIQDCVELLTLPTNLVDSIEELAEASLNLSFDHTPTPHILLEWRDKIVGPFNVEFGDTSGDSGRYSVTIRPKQANREVLVAPLAEFERACGSSVLNLSREFTQSNHARRESGTLTRCSYRLMTAGGIDRFLENCEGKWLQLEPLDESLVRLSRGILTRKRKQELGALLSELRDSAATAEDPALLLDRISKVDSSTSKFADGIGKVVDAMLETGLIDEQAIEDAKKRHAEAFIESQSAELQAEIEEQINQAKEEYRQTSNELASLNKALLATRTKATKELERDLAAMRKDAEAELKLERENLDLLRSELDDKQESLKNDLEQATKSFTESSDAVVNRFLTIAPILRKAGMLGLSEQNAANGTSEQPPRVRPPQSFSIPQTIFEGSGNTGEDNMSEKSFFDRLTELVKNAGFSYSRDDLARFHLSVKCGGLTIIAGNSGTGKSSLATLYARALAGSEFSPDRPDYLMINVNPSWMDIRDLLGHLNTLEGRYFPAESGLYQHLICAQEEIKRAAGSSAIYPICFDEMNLAQVEHYFNDFMQLLEKSSGQRKIRCFSQEVISPECPFRNWPTLDISPAVRFVGTVNFDETTRRLSDRLLDRANLVSMGAGELPALVAGADSSSITCQGSRVTLSDFQRWVRDAALPTSLATIFTSIRVPLQRLGCPVSARGYRATCRFVASSDPILSAEAALDIQVTQRLLSRVRNLVSKDQFEALDDLELILTKSPCGFDRSLEKISEIRSAETAVDFNV